MIIGLWKKSHDQFVENILMVYKYCENKNFEDLASGKVIVHRAGYPNFPVRLAQEIFSRCLHYLDDPDSVCIYDPCCGGGYLLTVLGFLNFEKIKTIMASDISDDAIQLTNENLSLLDKNGLKKRIRQINDLLSLYNKHSHIEALNSATNLLDQLLPVTKEKTIVAICSDKSQKFQSDSFQRIEKQVIGKRLFKIFRFGSLSR